MFKEYLKNINIEISPDQEAKFQLYFEYLVKMNSVMNLTAITEREEVYIKHFYDSLLVSKCIDLNNKTLVDVGSGAGFPSIPLAILNPSIRVTIIDSLNKRIKFLNDLIKLLGLNNVEALHYRAEDYAKIKRESFDIATARAVARLNVLSELCIPLVKPNGFFIALKGTDATELPEASTALSTLGVKFLKEDKFLLPLNMGERTLYSFIKVKKTPLKYPRQFKDIKNKPL